MTGLLQGQNVLVVGGSGMIGSAIARLFAEHGASMCVHYHRNRELAEEVVGELKARGCRCIASKADICNPREAEQLVDGFVREFGCLDVLVNASGIARDNLVHFLAEPEWDQVIQVDLNGPVFTCKAAAKHMVPRRSGRIVNIASVTGSTGQEMRTNYGAAKGALLAFTKAAARELTPFGVRVNAVAPQIIEGGLSTGASPKVMSAMEKMTPAGRLGKGSDVAGATLFLASDLSDFITGEVLLVTGGLITYQI